MARVQCVARRRAATLSSRATMGRKVIRRIVHCFRQGSPELVTCSQAALSASSCSTLVTNPLIGELGDPLADGPGVHPGSQFVKEAVKAQFRAGDEGELGVGQFVPQRAAQASHQYREQLGVSEIHPRPSAGCLGEENVRQFLERRQHWAGLAERRPGSEDLPADILGLVPVLPPGPPNAGSADAGGINRHSLHAAEIHQSNAAIRCEQEIAGVVVGVQAPEALKLKVEQLEEPPANEVPDRLDGLAARKSARPDPSMKDIVSNRSVVCSQ